MPDFSAIFVTHRSASEIPEAVDSLRRAALADGLRGELIVVDCASPEEDRETLRRLEADRLILLPENRGYSGGLNAGLTAARSGRLLLANPDVLFESGCLAALLGALDDPEVGAAAPLQLWDREGKIHLPPGFRPGFLRELGEAFCGRAAPLDRRRFAAFAREAWRIWQEGGNVEHLAGAVMVARKDVFDRVGRFDESFLFEYEETEWEDRVRAAGLRLRVVSRARACHLFARSARRSPEAAERRAASRRLYRRRRYGAPGSFVLASAERWGGRLPPAQPIEEARLPAHGPGLAVAVSPNRSLLPFAGASLEEEFQLPPEAARSLPPGPVYLRVFETRSGAPRQTFVWENRP